MNLSTLLSDISDCQRLLIVGGSGTGKTSLLLHIAEQRAELGDLIILDSNGKKGKWGAFPVVGLGYDHQAIKDELQRLNQILKTRFNEYAFGNTGEREHSLITVIADEWHIISTEIKDIADLTRPILTQGRKLSIDLIVGSHGATAKSLGLSGEMDLVQNFEAILRLNKIKNERLVAIDFGDGEIIYQHCGAFNHPHSGSAKNYVNAEFQKQLDSILYDPIVQDSLIKEQKIVEKYHELVKANSYSDNKLCKAIYGYSNGQKVAEIKAILASHGIVTSQ
jgi:hypothetical protein